MTSPDGILVPPAAPMASRTFPSEFTMMAGLMLDMGLFPGGENRKNAHGITEAKQKKKTFLRNNRSKNVTTSMLLKYWVIRKDGQFQMMNKIYIYI